MAGRDDSWATLRQSLLWVLEASVVGLVLTGVPLVWTYRPVGGRQWISDLHGTAGIVALASALALAAVSVAGRRAGARSAPAGWVSGALAAAVLTVAGLLTGPLLAWDHIAFWAVTVGEVYSGALAPLSHDVRFLLVDGREVSVGTYKTWVTVHVVVLPLVGLAGTAVVRHRRRQATAGADALQA